MWLTDANNDTYCLAMGDVDLDGDLDVVFGNVGNNPTQANTLYLNTDGALGTSPAWQSSQRAKTYTIALGDIDGDHDLDLVCGDFSGEISVYLNVGGASVFSPSPAWTSGTIMVTQDIMLGDVDADGDLDLVCANGSATAQPRFMINRLYLNNGTMLETTPAWESGDAVDSRSVALGDVDGDGDLDIVFGNAGISGLPNTTYLNVGGPPVFESAPAWYSADTLATTAVVLGDMDGDGDLDLVCGNGDTRNERNTFHENTGIGFSPASSWRSTESSRTTDVALGDVDGDGDLDMVSGDYFNLRLYVNDGSVLDTTSVWVTPRVTTPCRAAALADCDMNGDLDIVAAMSGIPQSLPKNRVYENVTLPFAPSPDWEANAGGRSNAHDVELGDLDGDGDLDAVFGIQYSGIAVEAFFNQDGQLEPTSRWTVGLPGATGGGTVTLGDVDGDGDPDIKTKYTFPRIEALFLNNGGMVTLADSVWALPAYAIAGSKSVMEDVTGDGRIDLILGAASQPSTRYNTAVLFANMGLPDIFPDVPTWATNDEIPLSSYPIVGDVNGDGALDLLVRYMIPGVQSEPYEDRLFLNHGSGFNDFHSWSTKEPTISGGVWWSVFADVNGDRRLDLISKTDLYLLVYLNTGELLERVPSTSIDYDAGASPGLAVGDVDGDSDLDLVTGTRLILNEGGTLGAGGDIEIWPIATQVRRIALGDIDRDGDLDAVTARNLGNNLMYLNRKHPVFKGDPLSPTHHTPQNGVFIKNTRATRVGPNTLRVTFMAYDVESDDVWVIPEYQFEGMWTYDPVDRVGGVSAMGPLASAPSGIEHSFDWDISRVPFDTKDVVLRLRTASIPGRVSVVQHAAAHVHKVGRITPTRPQIANDTGRLVFPTVTVGDTTSVDLVLSNTGTAVLTVDSISLPSAEMRIDRTLPINIDPGMSDVVTVSVNPCVERSIKGSVQIKSNDPLTPLMNVAVTTDIRALDIELELLSQTERLPLGEAVTVTVIPAPDVSVEGGYLYHRPSGEATFQDSIPLSRSKLGFVAVIPGVDVTEQGLDYYVRVQNDCVEATDPPDAPGVFYSRQVEAPVAITTTPVPTGESGFLEGLSIRVGIELPQGATYVAGTAHFRPGGATLYASAPVAFEGGIPFAVLPDSVVGPRGVEYWVQVQTLTNVLMDPPLDPTTHPHTIQVSIADLAEPAAAPGLSWRMVSVPLDFGSDFAGTLAAVLSDQGEFGPYDPIQWRCFRYDPAHASFAELPDEGSAHLFQLRPGRGFWLITRGAHRMSTAPVTGVSVSTQSPYEITLEPGWNQVGHPFVFPAAWDAMAVDTLTAPEAVDSGVVHMPVRWVPGAGYQYDASTLEPFEGYWIRNLTSSPVHLSVPPIEAASAEPAPARVADEDLDDRWEVRIVAASGDVVDRCNVVGIDDGARTGWDTRDYAEAPLGPGPMLSLYFPHDEWEARAGAYTTDIRSGYEAFPAPVAEAIDADPHTWGQAWRFDVAKNFTYDPVGDEVLLVFEGVSSVPGGARAYLIDHHMQHVVNLHEESRYTFYLGNHDVVETRADTRFTLVVGSEHFVGVTPLPPVPVRTALRQNYPNPFNPTTLIEYDIAAAEDIAIRIYDARGALVVDLYRGYRKPGRYVVPWHGKNAAGQQVASGIYFYRLSTPSATLTRKMVMIK